MILSYEWYDTANAINMMHMCTMHDEKCFFAHFFPRSLKTIKIMQIIICAIYEHNLNAHKIICVYGWIFYE